MDFIANSSEQNAEMLRVIGVDSVDQLFAAIPASLRLPPPIKDDGISESEGIRHMEALAKKNRFPDYDSYLGAGAYEHHQPAIVGPICSKSEFLTSYTPYQAEASQGMLQTIFEFQTAFCHLTGLDVANASLYDGASACAEALLMAMRVTKRHKVLIAGNLHPHYREVIRQYLCHSDMEIVELPFQGNGLVEPKTKFDENTAALLLAYPNFFGSIDPIATLNAQAKSHGALTILCGNPLVYGLYASAAELGADIAVGDCQPLGLTLQYGGPYAGYLACRHELIRQMPGRLVGETVDAEGRRGFVLTLQTREQYIRREKATSNICTTQSLAALASLITLAWYGKEGLRQLALTNYQRAAYLRKQLEVLTEETPFSSTDHFNEFVVRFKQSMDVVLPHFRAHGIEPGLDLGRYFPQLQGHLLVAVTELKSKQQLDHYIEVARKLKH